MRERHLTTKAMADALGVSTAAVRGWAAQGCPSDNLGRGRDKGYRFNAEEVIQWMEANGKSTEAGGDRIPETGAVSAGADVRDLLVKARLRKIRADARKSEIQALREEGKVVDAEQARNDLLQRAAYLKMSLMSAPAQLAPRLAGLPLADIEDELTKWVTGCLREYSRQ